MAQRTLVKDLHSHIGEEVSISGWIDTRRDHGKIVFIDLRDFSGIVQTVIIPKEAEAYQAAGEARSEWVVEIKGMLNKRPEKMVNPDLPTGDIEIYVTGFRVITKAETPPFDVSGGGHEIDEELRLTYRYLDLRRPRLAKNLRARHAFIKEIRDYLAARDFVEVETPILTKSTPEGARDYVVPSRINKGEFYALPQSPQQYKQLLMVAGLERYFQIARCLRDEDTRGDRQPEFTQLDIEMSFVTQEDILRLVEEMFTTIVEKLYPEKRIMKKPWPRLTYKEAMERYGNDKPDLRENKDDPNELAFGWVLDFPLFEPEDQNGPASAKASAGKHYAPSHHMFTAPREEDVAKLDTEPLRVRAYQHDLVLNGYEVGGGSIRIHDPALQAKIFDLIGFDDSDKENFKHMLTAFSYGVPPHGGIAPGLDRLLMILQNEPNIREVIAFPKTGDGRDLMMGAPSRIKEEQLKELGIKIIES
ncbi:MAG: aspartate--tRNA ligase [Parcubacteria group bacterium]|nr:aspartate--tRNA ligase [Parcubacteria group bacterium]